MSESVRALACSRIRVGVLLAATVSLAGCGPFRETALQKAIKAHDAAAVKRELAAGAPLGSSWLELTPARRLAILSTDSYSPESIEVLRLLVAAAPDRSAFVHEAFSAGCRRSPCYAPAPVEYLARQRSIEAVQVLIDAGLDLRSQGVANAVVYAIAEGDDALARHLIEAGADVHGRAESGGNRFGEISLLEAARRKENAAMVAYLIARGAQ